MARDRITRRRVLSGGAALAGALVFGVPARAQRSLLDTRTRTDNLFWTQAMVEHAVFLSRFLSGPELVSLRARAMQYQSMFAGHLANIQSESPHEPRAMSRATVELIRPFVDFKHELRDASESGRIRSLAWPSYYAHVALEGERAVRQLSALARGEAGLDRGEVIGFWAQALGDHAKLLAHMLDPLEKDLIDRANVLADRFDQLERDRPELPDPLMAAVDEIVDFKTAALAGIEAGTVRSVISPLLADHVRREALKAADELQRVGIVQARR